LSGETSTVHNRPPTPFSRVDSITNNTEINSSHNSFPTEYQDTAEEKTESNSSAQSGFNLGGSDNNLDISFTSQGYNDDDNPRKSKTPPPVPPIPPPVIPPPLLSATTTFKMATFDAELEDLFKKIMKYELSTPLVLAVHKYGVTKFEQFRSLGSDLDELPKLTIPSGTTPPVDKTISKIDAKALTKAVIYALFMEDSNHASLSKGSE
jgi:hypothetical protein